MILNRDTGILVDGSIGVSLSAQQTAILAVIAGAYPNPASREDIIAHVWPDGAEPDWALKQLGVVIFRIRIKLMEARIAPLIITTRGRGFLANRAIQVSDIKSAESVVLHARRTKGHVLVDLLRGTNGGPVALPIIRGVLWPDTDREPADWAESVRHLAYVTGRLFGIRISAITHKDFVGYAIHD